MRSLHLFALATLAIAGCRDNGSTSPPPIPQPQAAAPTPAPTPGPVSNPAPQPTSPPVQPVNDSAANAAGAAADGAAPGTGAAPVADPAGSAGNEPKVFRELWENGKVKREFQMSRGADGKFHKNGWCRQYYSDGILERDGTYVDDDRVGVWHFYDDQGKLAKTTDFGAGRPKKPPMTK